MNRLYIDIKSVCKTFPLVLISLYTEALLDNAYLRIMFIRELSKFLSKDSMDQQSTIDMADSMISSLYARVNVRQALVSKIEDLLVKVEYEQIEKRS